MALAGINPALAGLQRWADLNPAGSAMNPMGLINPWDADVANGNVMGMPERYRMSANTNAAPSQSYGVGAAGAPPISTLATPGPTSMGEGGGRLPTGMYPKAPEVPKTITVNQMAAPSPNAAPKRDDAPGGGGMGGGTQAAMRGLSRSLKRGGGGVY